MSPHLHLKCLDSLTVSGLAPEIAMWRLYTDDKAGDEDWYIKPNVYVFSDPMNCMADE